MASQKCCTLILQQTVALGVRCMKWQLVLPRLFPSTSISTKALLVWKSWGLSKQWMVHGSCATGKSKFYHSLYFLWKQRIRGTSFCPNDEGNLPNSPKILLQTKTVWVTSNGTIVIGRPLQKTMAAAQGSIYILNSAAAEAFPIPMAPPIIVIPLMCYLISGKALRRMARLVIAPVTTNQTCSCSAVISLQMWRKGFSVTACLGECLSYAPQSPVGP